MISRPLTSLIALIEAPELLMHALDLVLEIRSFLDECVDRDELLEQDNHAFERPGIGTVAKRGGRLRMRLHEQAGDAGGDRRAREYRHVLPLASRRRAARAGALHRVRRIENDGTARAAHDRE